MISDEILRRRGRFIVILFVVQLLFALALAYFANESHTNSTAIRALAFQNAQTQAQNAQSQIQFNLFLKAFLQEQNYACTILQAQAAKEQLNVPPGDDICKVQVPR